MTARSSVRPSSVSKGLHLFGPVRREAILQIDPGQGRGELPQVRRQGTDDAGELAKGPVRRCDRFIGPRQDQVQPFAAVREASTRMSAVSTTRDRLRSDRPFTDAKSASRARYRSSSGRLNHSDETRPFRCPWETSTFQPPARAGRTGPKL